MYNYKSDDFCLTFTLNPIHHQKTLSQQEKCLISVATDCMNFIFPLHRIDYIYTTELTKKHVFHIHAYIVFDNDYSKSEIENVIKVYKRKFDQDQILGFYTVRTCYDKQNWISYMHKNMYVDEEIAPKKELGL